MRDDENEKLTKCLTHTLAENAANCHYSYPGILQHSVALH